jgi:hypothetical protein
VKKLFDNLFRKFVMAWSKGTDLDLSIYLTNNKIMEKLQHYKDIVYCDDFFKQIYKVLQEDILIIERKEENTPDGIKYSYND